MHVVLDFALDLFRSLVTLDDVVLGVGFRAADDALDLSKLSRQVYAFEPNPFAFARVKKAVRKRKNVQLFNMGVGAKEETVRLRLPELVDQPQGARSAPVQLMRLDKVQFAISPTCLVLNCGGSELEALIGAQGLLSSGTLRTVLLKSHRLPDERETGPEATLWLLEHGFSTEPRKAEDGSLWIIGRAHRITHGPPFEDLDRAPRTLTS
jgi:FkbM family methyltransferase